MITIELLAQILHGATSAIPRIDGTTPHSWEYLSVWDKKRAISAVKEILAGEDITPEDGHRIWQEKMRKDGWRYGTQFNAERKIHPSLIPFEELDLTEVLKDIIWATLTRELRQYVNE